MLRSEFSFHLPDHLIAQRPCAERTASRLLVLDREHATIEDKHFSDILAYLEEGDLLVMNDTRVIKARLHGHKDTGGKVEILIERVTGDHSALAQIKASKAPKPDQTLELDEDFRCTMTGRDGDLFLLNFEQPVMQVLDAVGHIPLPPYITRDDNADDAERYQTVFGQKAGAVAAPTAGLHMDEALLDQLQQKGVQTTFVTLHVGAGTFLPMRVDDVNDHVMHKERIEVSAETCALIKQTRDRGKRVIALGTTTVRALESASHDGEIAPFTGETDIFIYPGYRFRSVDALITNFHLPESTLLMLVSAFAGKDTTLRAYQHAVDQAYRFFSYGDAMFIYGNPPHEV